jgi:hypothetical protein
MPGTQRYRQTQVSVPGSLLISGFILAGNDDRRLL